MFTGIIEDTGTVEAVNRSIGSRLIYIKTPFDLDHDKLGDSVSVNGICLTITTIKGNMFSADVSEETFKRTNMGSLKIGSRVNLERALKVGDRLGGHIVTGHVDSIGTIKKRDVLGKSICYQIGVGQETLQVMVEKGSVAVDGTSLTVNEVGADFFSVNIIPHTSSKTTITSKGSGDKVNIETDILSKYVQKLVNSPSGEGNLSLAFLNKCGFI